MLGPFDVHCEAMYALPFCLNTPEKFISPFTSSVNAGDVVFNPTLPPVVNKLPIVFASPVANKDPLLILVSPIMSSVYAGLVVFIPTNEFPFVL